MGASVVRIVLYVVVGLVLLALAIAALLVAVWLFWAIVGIVSIPVRIVIWMFGKGWRKWHYALGVPRGRATGAATAPGPGGASAPRRALPASRPASRAPSASARPSAAVRQPIPCYTCGSTGRVQERKRNYADGREWTEMVRCPSCGGRGNRGYSM